MSFILDALKKSETERQRQSTPALFEVQVAAPRPRYPAWAVGLAVLLAVNVVFLAYVLWRAPAEDARAATANPPAPSSTSPTAPTPSHTPGPAGATVTLPATVTVTIPPAAGVTVAGSTEPGLVAPSEAPPLAEEPLLSVQEPSVPPDYDPRDHQPAVSPTAGVAMAEAAGAPSRDELVARGQSLPELRLDLHVYDPDPAARFVFINMRKLREGDTLPEGVRVEEITARGARLSFRGTYFTLDGH